MRDHLGTATNIINLWVTNTDMSNVDTDATKLIAMIEQALEREWKAGYKQGASDGVILHKLFKGK